MNIVEIKNLCVSYERQEILSNVNLEIREEDFIAVIGPNGGGKTSLMKAILGLVPHQGKILFSPLLRGRNGALKIGYMPQVSLFDRDFPITIEEVVISGLATSKPPLYASHYTKEHRQIASEWMARTGISSLARNRINEVSGGELQRALLCRAIISQPKLLILDEPTNFVDNSFEGEFYRLLKELHKDMAIVMVSHDIGSVSSVVKQIVCVNRSVHRHDSNIITREQLDGYNCPIQIITHGDIPHTILPYHTTR